MLPGIPDKKIVYQVTKSSIQALLDCGARVYLYPGFLHAKMVVADDGIATIGTFHILNRFWYRSLGKGKYTAFRVFQTAINLLLLPCMAGLIISGIIMSRHVFAFLPISGGLSLARMMHLVCAYWGFVLMSIHIGLHWGMIMGMARKAAKLTFSSYKRTALLRAAAVIIAGYGIYAFIARQMPQYMLLIIQFAFFDYEQPKILFFADYLAVMGSFIFLGHYAAKFLRHRTARNCRTSGSDS